MSHQRIVLSHPLIVGTLCLSLFFLPGCGGKEEKTPEQLGKPKSMDQEVFDRATKAFAKVLVGTWVVGVPKTHPEYDPTKVLENPLEYQFTADNTGYLDMGVKKFVFIYSVSGKVITLNIEGEDPEEMKFTLFSEDMISLEMDGRNIVFARKGK